MTLSLAPSIILASAFGAVNLLVLGWGLWSVFVDGEDGGDDEY